MTGFWTPIFAFIARMFASWGHALFSGAPSWLKPHLQASRKTRIVTLEEDQNIGDVMRGNNADVDWIVSIGKKSVLFHEFNLPKQAAHDLKKIIRLEAARVMPIAVDRLSLAYKMVPSKNAESVTVFLFAMRRKFLDSIVASAKRFGSTIHSVGVDFKGETGFIKFPVRDIIYRQYLRRAGYLVASAFLFVMLAVLPQFYLSKLERALFKIESEINVARTSTTKIAGLQSQLKNTQLFSEAVQERKGQGKILQLLTSLTKESPDDVFLEEMRLDGRRLYLKGQAQSPEKWVLELQRLAYFEKVRLTSVQGGESDSVQRFDLQLNIVWKRLELLQ